MNAEVLFVCIVMASFASAWLITWLLRLCARRIGLEDIPNERSLHVQPVPRGGGLSIVLVVLVGVWAITCFTPTLDKRGLVILTLGAALVAGVSLIDDLYSLPRLVRFGAHAAGAALTLWGLGHWHTIGWPGLFQAEIGAIGLPLGFLWIVGLTNAYNFMDGSDGIAATQALVAGLGWAIIGTMVAVPVASTIGLLSAAAALGFLLHNWQPARIFMGDVGSAFLGYTFACLPLTTARAPVNQQQVSWMPVIGVLLVWPFVFDAVFTFFRRLKKRENVFAAHRSHLYQRLIIAGWSHRGVALLYGALALGGLAVAAASILRACLGFVLGGIPLLALGLWFLTIRVEMKRKV
jgi:UDP-N-acetylmuramyl pentapeptide phosphotransferase/UDP-N-acetylglucosamine-1-phosphate transferase